MIRKGIPVVRRLMLAMLVLAACAPVLDRKLADKAFLNVPLASMTQYPLLYQGDLYLLGGLIVDARQSERGLLIEALYIPVNRRGYLRDQGPPQGAYLALLPQNGPGIDELTYRPGTYITAAAEFRGTDAGRGSTQHYPLFSVRDIHAWGSDYTRAFDLPSGQPGRITGDRPVDPLPIWENPVTTD